MMGRPAILTSRLGDLQADAGPDPDGEGDGEVVFESGTRLLKAWEVVHRA